MNFIEILHILPPILNKYHLLLLTEGFFFIETSVRVVDFFSAIDGSSVSDRRGI